MTDELDQVQARIKADTERAIENRRRFGGESAVECADCGDEIPQPRREALPGIDCCVECAGIRERRT